MGIGIAEAMAYAFAAAKFPEQPRYFGVDLGKPGTDRTVLSERRGDGSWEHGDLLDFQLGARGWEMRWP